MNHLSQLLISYCGLLVASSLLKGDELKFDHEFKPALLTGTDSDERTVAARFKFGVKKEADIAGADARLFATTQGTVAWKSRVNSDNMTAELGGGLWRRFGGTADVTEGDPVDGNARNPVVGAVPGSHDYLVNVDLKLGFETDQRFENTQLAYGPRIGFAHTENDGWWPLLPSVDASFLRIDVLESEFLSASGVPERSFWRLGIDLSWKWRPFEQTGIERDWLKPVGLHADVRYFRAYDLPTQAGPLNIEDSLYTAGTISYSTTGLEWKYLQEVYLTVSHGRLPPSTKDETMIFIGVAVLK